MHHNLDIDYKVTSYRRAIVSGLIFYFLNVSFRKMEATVRTILHPSPHEGTSADQDVRETHSNETQSEYERHVHNSVLVKRTRLKARNNISLSWSLVAKRDIVCGSFIGFYTGSMEVTMRSRESDYALDMGYNQPCIYPFEDESKIRSEDREKHPFASMNEPNKGDHANCHMVIQDFDVAEIADVTDVYNHTHAHFFRGLACFACCDIKKGDELTWHYGNKYQPIRDRVGYEAGSPCKKVIDDERFVSENSRAVLDALGGRIPHYAVFMILKTQNIKSQRFKKRRKHTVDSEGEESDSFSSRDEVEAYKPRPSKRRKSLSVST